MDWHPKNRTQGGAVALRQYQKSQWINLPVTNYGPAEFDSETDVLSNSSSTCFKDSLVCVYGHNMEETVAQWLAC